MSQRSEPQLNRMVTVRRRIRSTRAFLYQAWADPLRLARWFGPQTWMVERCDTEARRGGPWRVWLKRGDGVRVEVGGIYTDLEPDRRVSFTWNAQGGQPEVPSIVTVELVDCLEASRCA